MKGILFKPWKIAYIAEHPDIEIQTRRVIKPQPPEGAKIWRIEDGYTGEGYFSVRGCYPWHTIKPRYQQGETVYIKEPLRRKYNDPSMPCDYITYVSDATAVSNKNPNEKYPQFGRPTWIWERNTVNPMFMPRWAARYFITITDVRAERLQEITLGDIIAEGFGDISVDEFNREFLKINSHLRESNPWVWVYTFRREK